MFHFIVDNLCSWFDISWKKTGKNTSDSFINQIGVTATDLNPKGEIEINGQVISATTEGFYLPQDKKVRVIRIGHKLAVVESIEDET